MTAAFFAGVFFAAGLLVLVDEREAFSVILLSHSSISASSDIGATVIAGRISRSVTGVTCGEAEVFTAFGTFTFFLVIDETSDLAVAAQLILLKFLKKY